MLRLDTTSEGWGLLLGQQWGPQLGHQWGLLHGHGHLAWGVCAKEPAARVARLALLTAVSAFVIDIYTY